MVKGAGLSIVLTFPLAALIAAVFRFPVPFAPSYQSGIEAIVPAMFAVFFYGIFFGGIVIVACLGVIAGHVVAMQVWTDESAYKKRLLILSAVAAGAPLLLLSVLDLLIGRW